MFFSHVQKEKYTLIALIINFKKSKCCPFKSKVSHGEDKKKGFLVIKVKEKIFFIWLLIQETKEIM